MIPVEFIAKQHLPAQRARTMSPKKQIQSESKEAKATTIRNYREGMDEIL